jgi:hypothetical protein
VLRLGSYFSIDQISTLQDTTEKNLKVGSS